MDELTPIIEGCYVLRNELWKMTESVGISVGRVRGQILFTLGDTMTDIVGLIRWPGHD